MMLIARARKMRRMFGAIAAGVMVCSPAFAQENGPIPAPAPDQQFLLILPPGMKKLAADSSMKVVAGILEHIRINGPSVVFKRKNLDDLSELQLCILLGQPSPLVPSQDPVFSQLDRGLANNVSLTQDQKLVDLQNASARALLRIVRQNDSFGQFCGTESIPRWRPAYRDRKLLNARFHVMKALVRDYIKALLDLAVRAQELIIESAPPAAEPQEPKPQPALPFNEIQAAGASDPSAFGAL